MIIFDSSVIIEILNGTALGEKIIREFNLKDVMTTAFSLYEVELGSKPHEIEEINRFFEEIKILNFEQTTAKESAAIEKALSRKGQMINKIDIFIAATCKANNALLITKDKDFLKIPGLEIKMVAETQANPDYSKT